MDARAELDLSVCIITLNEEMRLARCLKSLPAGCEIIVVDSGSTDQTKLIARQFGAQVIERSFDDYASQKNAALDYATRTWILSIDADEQLSSSLTAAIALHLPSTPNSMFQIERRLVFMGRHMRFGKTKDAPIRLFPRSRARFVGKVHENLTSKDGLKVGRFKGGYLLHFSYDDLTDYFDKFNRYTTQIALRKQTEGHPAGMLAVTVLRPWWEFFSRYFLRLGCLDGYPGYCYALISSLYGFVKYAKYQELTRSRVRD